MDRIPSEADIFIQRPAIEDSLLEYLDEGKRLVHITGEPGVGKTSLLSYLKDTYGEHAVTVKTIGEHHSIQHLYREVYSAIFDRLPEETKEGDRRLTGLSGSAFGFGGGVSLEAESPEAPNLQLGYRDVLSQVSNLFPDHQHLVICIDDVHKLSDHDQAIRDAINEAASYLDANITLVTAGRLTFDGVDSSITVSMFSESQTVDLLSQAFPDIAEDRAKHIHERLSGHPLYIGLIIESDDAGKILDIPQDDIYDEIEERYIRSMSDDEERFLIATSPLQELNERICTAVMPDKYGFDQVDISRILRSLRERVIVQDLGRGQESIKSYKIHDTFRDFLLRRLGNGERDQAHRKAFSYYSGNAIEAADRDEFEQEVDCIVRCLRHISETATTSGNQDLVEFVSEALTEDNFRFYSVALVLDEVKTWKTDRITESIVSTVIEKIGEQPRIAQHFLDESADRSWAEELLERGFFVEPEGPFLGYLRRIVSIHPDFVLEVIETTTIEQEGPRRLLLSISSDLPPEMAASISGRANAWIRDADSGQALNYQALDLVEHLCENDKIHPALDIMGAIIRPQDTGTGDQSRSEQAVSIYGITETLDRTFDAFMKDAGSGFVQMLESNLSIALEYENEEGQYHAIARRKSLAHLNYIQDNQSDLNQVLLECFVQTAEQWVAADPNGTDEKNLLDRLLSGPETFRRVGLYLLGNNAREHSDRVEAELVEERNYHDEQVNFEFYRLLESAFEQVEEEVQQEICELICNGPYADDIRARAEHFAQQWEETADSIERGIRKQWQRDRLYLLREHLPAEYEELLDELINEYGEPERLPTDPHHIETTGGLVNERGPEETEELADQPVRDVLRRCVDWEPPETETWETGDDGQLEEFNRYGFSSQVAELIKENTEEYAQEIAILKDADSQYAEAAFRAFRELLEDDQVFPWESIIELCLAITETPTEWRSACRKNIAVLLNKGIASDETMFPEGSTDRVREILFTLVVDADPDSERDQPPENNTGFGNPSQVAINTVRPMALNAVITFAGWLADVSPQSDELDQELRSVIQDRLINDPSLAVRSVIGRRLYQLWNLDQDLIKSHLEDLFPRGDDPTEQKRFLAAWNQYVTYNYLWGVDAFRPYYLHALTQLEAGVVEGLQIKSQSTAAHIASMYLFGEEELMDENSLISQFYSIASPDTAADLAASIASKARKDEDLDPYWEGVRTLWEWRLDRTDSEMDEYEQEFRQFLSCVRYIDTAHLPDEMELIIRSFSYIVGNRMIWRRIEEWLAEESEIRPKIAMQLYERLVEAVPTEEWADTAMDSREDHRKTIYENGASCSENARLMSLRVANRFAAENYDMDREFLDAHFGSGL